MKDFRCMIEIHDWTQWRRKPVKRTDADKLRELLATGELREEQSRRCRRCGKTQSRPFPSSRKQPLGVE